MSLISRGARLIDRAGRRLMAAAVEIRSWDIDARRYDAAVPTRDWESWVATDASANAEISTSHRVLRNRARDLVRNSPYAASGLDSWVTNLIGDGITPIFHSTGNAAVDEKRDRLWARWAKQASATDGLSVYGLQALSTRGMIESGESLIIRRRQRPADLEDVPLRLQVVEGDFIDSNRNQPFDGDSRIVNGVQVDTTGKITGYWLFHDHPGNGFGNFWYSQSGMSEFYRREDVIHLYRATRPGQVRGVPWLAPAMIEINQLRDYEFAEMMRKKAASAFALVVKGAGLIKQKAGVGDVLTDSKGKPYEKVQPGSIAYAPDGAEITQVNPAQDQGYPDWMNVRLHAIAAGFGIPYELLTKNLERVNFTSIRMGTMDYRRLASQIRAHVIVQLMLDRIFQWFIEDAVRYEMLPEADYRVKWPGLKWEELDRAAAAMADLRELRIGVTSITEICARRGTSREQVWRELTDDIQAAKDAGFVFDWDGSLVTANGIAQVWQSDPAADPARQDVADKNAETSRTSNLRQVA